MLSESCIDCGRDETLHSIKLYRFDKRDSICTDCLLDREDNGDDMGDNHGYNE